ncbi:MAG: hypothetical protein Q7T16_04400 [Candidatus Burarchaeum sp.]|nr:hypothetical protein [Candidatus Burarchaeum sp.]MDO8339870.1 hypothetical protein [Candidatus Burarchaeum sp.]
MRSLFALILAFLALSVGAAEVKVLSPVSAVLQDGSEVYLGLVGPGQTVFVEADALVATGGVNGIGGRWDQLVIDRAPQGWSTEPSLLYEQPLKALVKVASDAPDGEYEILVRVVDDQNKEQLGEVNLKLRINVSRDVLSMSVSPSRKETGASQPASFIVTLRNTGIASDAFEISASGLPAWDFRKTVFVPYGSSREVPYDVVSGEEGAFTVKIVTRSLSSDRISEVKDVHLGVSTTLISDYKATNKGLLLFPMFEQAAYAVMGLLSNLFS